MIGKILVRCGTAAVVMPLLVSSALAVDTMSDWTGQNNQTAITDPTGPNPFNNYSILSPTSVGGQIQSKVNFVNDPTQGHQYYLSDPSLVGTLDFTTELHMSGTITFSAPVATEPNMLFGWYSSADTRHRIGLGISNLTVAQGQEANFLRIDLGYAATGGNRFPFVSANGTNDQTNHNSVLPSGTYPFTFDYVPEVTGIGGTMSATVGTYFHTTQPLETTPWDLDISIFDRFGIVQRTTAINQTPFNVTFSNVTYTGGTAAVVAIPGDFDGDQDVDATDLGIWTTNFGIGTTVATGDADADGDADGNDFLIWQQNLTGAPVTAIPEPAAIALLSMASLAVLMRWRSVRK